MTTTESAPLTDVRDMLVVHRAFRREFRLAPRLVRAVVPGDTSRAAVVADHARLILTGLHLHHSGEDELLWPKLLERTAPEAALIARMEAQHDRVAHHIELLTPALTRWQAEARAAVTEEVAGLFDALEAALLEHLRDEEQHILPIAARHVSQREWDQLGEHAGTAMSPADRPVLLGMILEEATAEEARTLTANLPVPVRLIAKLVFLPRYRRYTKKLRAGLVAQS